MGIASRNRDHVASHSRVTRMRPWDCGKEIRKTPFFAFGRAFEPVRGCRTVSPSSHHPSKLLLQEVES